MLHSILRRAPVFLQEGGCSAFFTFPLLYQYIAQAEAYLALVHGYTCTKIEGRFVVDGNKGSPNGCFQFRQQREPGSAGPFIPAFEGGWHRVPGKVRPCPGVHIDALCNQVHVLLQQDRNDGLVAQQAMLQHAFHRYAFAHLLL